jgi:regulatory protein
MSPRRPEPPTDRPVEETADTESAVRTILLRRLSSAPRTRSELEKDLARRGADPAASQAVLDRFEEVGLIDDAEFAQMWVESRHRARGLARSVLRQELRERGVEDQLIGQALDQIDAEREEARAREFAGRKARLRAGENPAKAINRLAGQLARKGYPPSVCFQVAKDSVAALLEQRKQDVIDEMDAGLIVDDFTEHQESV